MSTSQNKSKFEKIKLDLANNFLGRFPEDLYKKYINVFSSEYLDIYSSAEIANDIAMIEELSASNPYTVSLKKHNGEQDNLWQIKLFKLNSPVSLSYALPIIENFGMQLLDENPKKLLLGDGNTIYVCDFGVLIDESWVKQLDKEYIRDYLKDGLLEVFNGKVENDLLNKLVLRCGLSIREINLLRSLAHYICQGMLPFPKETLKECLVLHPDIAWELFALFDEKFRLEGEQSNLLGDIRLNITSKLQKVNNLNDDRVLQAYLSTIDAIVRTNYYQLDDIGNPRYYISFKLESNKLDFLPKPRPLYEIFVYSGRFEGIHLRGGKVARGGIRWSERKDDYRTEVLGLIKAQIVKNSVIVPTGSKGGFICKGFPSSNNHKDARLADGIECYKMFISGLLEITDNLVAGKIIPPDQVIRYDEDDPYLVVAADKGTATFSDYANELSLKRKFWLGDAFASGGSAGYDHKKIGITARGAWESAKRHFRYLGKNIQKEDFTVVGIGDMSGDVFGNGMLLSKHIKLVGAFNHQHIFLDPSPDAMVSFEERKRLFKLPYSSWEDYDNSKISKGGGVFDRNLKSITLTDEVKKLLQIDNTTIAPNELINLLLKLDVDMIYNGGIGTYIKSSEQSNDMVKDKTNDSVRVDGVELRAKVVVEGGNLGATQLGRVSFAKKGGFIYTDAIDNSAGVDCSDHEVNIKILFADVMQNMGVTVEERNVILGQMTDDVAKLVLRHNYLQTQILRCVDTRSKELFSTDINFIEKLEKSGSLDRKVEFLPSTDEIMDRQRLGVGLTMPELSVLLAYSKIRLTSQILESNLVNQEIFSEFLVNYFPKILQDNYPKFIKKHYLRKEIIANQLANWIVNIMGITFVSQFEDELRVNVGKIVKAFWASYKLLNVERLLIEVESLDDKINSNIQIQMLIRIKKSIERLIRWILRNIKTEKAIVDLVDKYGDSTSFLLNNITNFLINDNYPATKQLDEWFISNDVPEKLAKLIARSNAYPQLLDIAMIAKETNHDLYAVAENYFYAGRILRFDWLRKSLIALPKNNKWQALLRSSLLADGYKLYSTLVRNAIRCASSPDDSKFVSSWIKNKEECVNQINVMLDELQNYKTLDLSMLVAVVRELSIMFAV